jgi:hypothetical protein
MSVAGQAAMLLLGLAWAFCERPAPLIYIVWKTGLTPQARQEAETELALRNPRPSNDSFEYELWVPTPGSVRAILASPHVSYVGRVDARTASIAPDAGHGRTRIWWAGPLSGARSPARFRWLFGLTVLVTLVTGYVSSPERLAGGFRTARRLQR